MSTLAKKYVISDSGLREICIRPKIPLPSGGYWMKLKHNQKNREIPLRDNPNVSNEIKLNIREEEQVNLSPVVKINARAKEIENENPHHLIIPDRLYKPDQLIKNKNPQAYWNKSWDKRNDAKLENLDHVNINVSKNLRDRAHMLKVILKNSNVHLQGMEDNVINKGTLTNLQNIFTKNNKLHRDKPYLLLQENEVNLVTINKVWQAHNSIYFVFETTNNHKRQIKIAPIELGDYSAEWRLLDYRIVLDFIEDQIWKRMLVGNTV